MDLHLKNLRKFICATLFLSFCCLHHAQATLYITEVMSNNENGLKDEDGDRPDWLEIYNAADTPVNLDGWWLTDKVTQPTQWRFPAVILPAKSNILIWASSKNRALTNAPLHTSFNLSANGEYIGLYRPDPTNGLPMLVTGYSFPALPADVSYGYSFLHYTTNFIALGEPGCYRVLTDAQGNDFYTNVNYAAGHLGHNQTGGWNVSPAFNDATWTSATTGIGYDTTGAFNTWIGTSPGSNCSNALRYVNSSLCFRRTFIATDPPTNLATLTLRMKYEDGFIAFVNGVEIGRANCSATTLAYNTPAATAINEAVVNSWFDYAVPMALLSSGTNLLAVQGLNVNKTSSDFLMLPTLLGTYSYFSDTFVYFSTPTPGTLNGTGASGPLLVDATPADPDIPRPLGNASSPPLTLTVRAIKTKSHISKVQSFYRTMWNAETSLTLLDNGVAPDATANDSIYSGNLPTTEPAQGQMLRWRFEAQDVQGVITKLPAYLDPNDSPCYFGTVAVVSSTATSQLPVLEWFVEGSPANGPTAAAFRGCCYFMTNFYDNTGHEIHGQSTAGFAKKSYDFDFTGEKRFFWRADEQRVKDINLLSNYADKTKTRNTFSHWVGQMTETPRHFAFPVRVHLNAAFHGVMDMMEDGDDRLLARNGLDPEGAFYKIYSPVFTTSAEKKTRKEESNADLTAFYNGLLPTDPAKYAFAYDNLDIPAAINYLVTRYLNSDVDHGHKNYYLYRDTNGTREWQPIIWDVDLSQGHVWNSSEGYFDDDLITNCTISVYSEANQNRLYNLIYSTPELQQMFVRRLKTLMDTLLQPPGTTNGIFDTQMRSIVATVDPDPANPSAWTDGDLDAARWGIDARFIQNRPREEVERVIASYFAPRRAFLFNQGAGRQTYNGLPIPSASQTNLPGMIVFDALDVRPASGSQHEYVILRNTTAQAIDLSGWTVDGQIQHRFKGGTIIPAGAGTAATNYIGLLHLAKDAYAFRARTNGPTGNQRRLVQGNYFGELSARGGTINLRDPDGALIATHTYPADPTPLQSDLRITELQYHPAPPTPAESAAVVGVQESDFEYIELLNVGATSLQLGNSWFAQGILFTFPSASLAPSARLIIAKNPLALSVRYPSITNTVTVLGPYYDDLSDKGERLELKDATGETILDFEYDDDWYPHTDGTGRSLVLREVSLQQTTLHLEDPKAWAICYMTSGSPGYGDVTFAQAYYGWNHFHFTETQCEDEETGGPYADPDSDGRVNWAEYALGTSPWTNDPHSISLEFIPVEAAKYDAISFMRASNSIDVEYSLWFTHDLVWEIWQEADSVKHEATPIDDVRETVILREATPSAAPQRFLKLNLDFNP